MNKYFILLIFYSFSFNECLIAQNKHGNIWVRQNGDPIVFMRWDTTPTPYLFTKPRLNNIYLTQQSTSVCNTKGQLMFYASGCGIIDREGKPLPNGQGINPGEIYKDYCNLFYPGINNVILLPKPDDSTKYVLLHTGIEKFYVIKPNFSITWPTIQFYYSEIDAKLNNGLGDVIKKNQPVFRDTIMALGIQACRHANGKDWWIIAPQLLTLGFQRVLLTSSGVHYVGEQRIKAPFYFWDTSIGQATFSNDGTKYAFGSPDDGIHIFDFDRCTGLFSNYRVIPPSNPKPSCVGIAFSPDSKLLYSAERTSLLQYDLFANEIAKSKMVIDTFDGTFSPDESTFFTCQIAPDNNIYIGTPSSNSKMHIIHEPNNRGLACNFKQQAIEMPGWAYIAMPNIPNYQLGASNPNCLLPVATKDEVIKASNFSVFPNPAYNKQITIETKYLNISKLVINFYNIQGQLVFLQSFQDEKTNISLPYDLPNGIYFWRVFDENRQIGQGKLVVLEN